MELKEIQHQIYLLKKAYQTLKEGIEKKDLSLLERDGVIQRFEFTIELTRKTLKQVLKYQGATSNLFPKEIIKEFNQKWAIKNLATFLNFLDLRNMTSHNYNESNTKEMFSFIKNNYLDFEYTITEINKIIARNKD